MNGRNMTAWRGSGKATCRRTELASQANEAIAKSQSGADGRGRRCLRTRSQIPPANAPISKAPSPACGFLMKDLGPTMKGRLQEMGSLLMRGNRATADTFLTAKMRQAGT